MNKYRCTYITDGLITQGKEVAMKQNGGREVSFDSLPVVFFWRNDHE
jgi:hypothetical protein